MPHLALAAEVQEPFSPCPASPTSSPAVPELSAGWHEASPLPGEDEGMQTYSSVLCEEGYNWPDTLTYNSTARGRRQVRKQQTSKVTTSKEELNKTLIGSLKVSAGVSPGFMTQLKITLLCSPQCHAIVFKMQSETGEETI